MLERAASKVADSTAFLCLHPGRIGGALVQKDATFRRHLITGSLNASKPYLLTVHAMRVSGATL